MRRSKSEIALLMSDIISTGFCSAVPAVAQLPPSFDAPLSTRAALESFLFYKNDASKPVHPHPFQTTSAAPRTFTRARARAQEVRKKTNEDKNEAFTSHE